MGAHLRCHLTSACLALSLVFSATDVRPPTSITSPCKTSVLELLEKIGIAGNLSAAAESLPVTRDLERGEPWTSALSDARRMLHSFELTEALLCAEEVLKFADRHPIAVAYVIEQMAKHPDCLAELETKSQAQTRCAQRWYKIGIHTLVIGNETEAATAMWYRATSTQTSVGLREGSGILWPSPAQTPTIWIEGLRSSPIWDCGKWPFVRTMEVAYLRILDEVINVTSRFGSSYPYLSSTGEWQNLFLYNHGIWDEALCAGMPYTCTLLKGELPTRPDVPFVSPTNEEIVIFRSKPNTSVGAHCGSSNNVINLHLTLLGALGTMLQVDKQDHFLEEGKSICFQDSYFHAIEHAVDGAAERISIVLRVMHPEIRMASFAGMNSTDAEDLRRWDTKAMLRREIERLRAANRRLSASIDASVSSSGSLPALASQDDHIACTVDGESSL
eukprot:TRINITY_DN74180_c0_g1_i1.p1 TRINITY_DN74180_c0_g1~~TRINITY_DN74180_c0_g1_i1.p1  ORF type:complete len:445 (+),score=47.64 TRINITY_DN74180_c0_g1_i1:49-1383(+)